MEIEDELPAGSSFDIRLRLRAESVGTADEVFIGLAPTGDVDRYLSDVAHEVVTDIEWGQRSVRTDRIDGNREPGPPGDETFWVESTTGAAQRTLDWELEEGSYRFVVMNADGGAGLDTRVRLGARVPFAYPLGIGFLIAAAVLAILAIVLIVFGVRARASRQEGPPPAAWGTGTPSTLPPSTGGEPAPSAAWRPPDQTP